MRQRHLSFLWTAALGLIAVVAASGAAAPALGADCGGILPCHCGDRVIANRTLTGADAVTTTVCTDNGLSVANGVNLDMGNRTITGNGVGPGVGILIED